ncbi:hypothetical protein GCM10011297_32120 [Bacterioplanes sanyensis]|uniref:hypothetical protein n=1 Tax=Bacterioplanes sanyensis TaxID=1249553 RepID=UPI001675D456|nr:hypothetical protein [Bacterioplanes sanyensis]GGY56962.1 hypothetical protein GCM10011297_32120 [Bacterioplanes sanyensis]
MDWIAVVDETVHESGLHNSLPTLYMFIFILTVNLVAVYSASGKRVTPIWFVKKYRESKGITHFFLLLMRHKYLGIRLLPSVILLCILIRSVIYNLVVDQPHNLLVLKEAIARGEGQCISGEFHYFEEVTVPDSPRSFAYLHFKDGRKYLLGGFERGWCLRATHPDSVIRDGMRENLGSTHNAEVKICWMNDLFDNLSQSRSPEYGKCIYEISVRKAVK